jgi:hypothetical protein
MRRARCAFSLRSIRSSDRLQVRTGFVAGKPKERDFRQAFDHEVARMERFLSPVRNR